MSSYVRIGAAAIAAAAMAAVACATEGEAEPLVPLDDAAVDARAPEPSDAGTAEEDAGPCAASGLCRVPVPVDERINLTAVSGSSPNDVWAVGTNRTVVHYDGKAWEKAVVPENDAAAFTMRAVWAGGPNDVWVGDGPALLHTTGWRGPNATEWTSSILEGSLTATPSAITGRDGHIFVARHFLGSFSNRDFALVISDGWGDGGPRDPAYYMDIFAGRETTGIWAMTLTRDDEAWVANASGLNGYAGRVFRVFRESSEAGAEPSWKSENYDSRTQKHLYGLWGDETAVWAVGEGGTIRRMTPERIPTRGFEVMPNEGLSDLRGIYGFGADDIWAVGDDATVLHWDGNVWTKLATPFDTTTKPRLFAVWGSGPSDVWIGGHAVMLHYTGKTP